MHLSAVFALTLEMTPGCGEGTVTLMLSSIQQQLVRREERHLLLYRTAVIEMEDREILCLLCNVSASGFAVRLLGKTDITPACVLQLSNGAKYEAHLVWQDADRAGFEFGGPVDVRQLIAVPLHFEARPIRLRLNRRIKAWMDEKILSVDLLDISVGGAKLRGLEGLRFGNVLNLNIEDLGSVKASVRWRNDQVTGVMFSEPLKFSSLAQWSTL